MRSSEQIKKNLSEAERLLEETLQITRSSDAKRKILIALEQVREAQEDIVPAFEIR